MASRLFISHSTKDDAVVREVQRALGDFDQDVWIDSRELRGGDPLWTEIENAIHEAEAYAIVVSLDSLRSSNVERELRYALGAGKRVVPLSLDGTQLSAALETLFAGGLKYVPIRSDAGVIYEALDAILVALGKRLPADVPPEPQPTAEALEELVLELIDLTIHEEDGKRRASAQARLIYEPAGASAEGWRFVAPLGPIELEELRWYLEKYAIWPSEYFRELATVRLAQRRYKEALAAYEEARDRFLLQDEPGTVAATLHQIGMVHQHSERPEAAEDAYRESLAIKVRLGDIAGQAGTLTQLGNLYDDILGRSEQAAAFFRQSTEKYVELGDDAAEGLVRSNLADTLAKLQRFEEARKEILRAIECKKRFGHASEPWKSWAILWKIETQAGNPTAAGEAREKPETFTSPTAMPAVRTTMLLAASVSPSRKRCWPAILQLRRLSCSTRRSIPSFKLCRPSSTAAAIALSPTIPICFTPRPPKSSS